MGGDDIMNTQEPHPGTGSRKQAPPEPDAWAGEKKHADRNYSQLDQHLKVNDDKYIVYVPCAKKSHEALLFIFGLIILIIAAAEAYNALNNLDRTVMHTVRDGIICMLSKIV